MANLGDVGKSVPSPRPQGTIIAAPVYGNLEAVSVGSPLPRPFRGGLFTRVKAPTSVVVNISDASLDDSIALFQAPAGYVETTRAGGSGAYFYDLDDGTYYATSVSREQAWRVEVSGASVVVTDLFPPTGGGQSEPMFASVS